jgi:hypothetical protein
MEKMNNAMIDEAVRIVMEKCETARVGMNDGVVSSTEVRDIVKFQEIRNRYKNFFGTELV